VQLGIEDSYKRLLNPAISNEACKKLKLRQFDSGFANNLKVVRHRHWEKNVFSY
jgi:hypothetical protein